MGAGLSTEALLALLDAGDEGMSGSELMAALGERRRRTPRSSDLLVALLGLEGIGQVMVDRGEELRFSLTLSGRARAYELGGGRPVHVRLLMADLVGFVSYTEAHGDEAARDAAHGLATAAAAAVRRAGGEVVKGLGDGFLAWLPPGADPLPVVHDVVACWSAARAPLAAPIQVRAASHVGNPIRHGTDLYGGDVNLVARLCDLAGPGELVVSRRDSTEPTDERVTLRGLAEPVAVARMAFA